MSELAPAWADYLHLQTQTCRRYRVDATAWGLEAGLDHLLAKQGEGCGAAPAVERGTARERHRARLRLHYFDSRQVNDPASLLADRDRLHRFLASVHGNDRRILLATGFGHGSASVARLVSQTPTAVRQRVARLRVRFSPQL